VGKEGLVLGEKGRMGKTATTKLKTTHLSVNSLGLVEDEQATGALATEKG
jgi:hypothetical protein